MVFCGLDDFSLTVNSIHCLHRVGRPHGVRCSRNRRMPCSVLLIMRV